MMEHPRNGFALPLALWGMIVLSLLATSIIVVSRRAVEATSSGEIRARLLTAAEAGINLVFEKALSGEGRRELPTSFVTQIDKVAVSILITSENGRIGLNRADERLLAVAFEAAGLDDDRAQRLAAAVADWRDEDNLPRPGGAEGGDYDKSSQYGLPRNRAFQTVGELALVRGAEGVDVKCLYDIFTVASSTGTLDQAAASNQVKAVLERFSFQGNQALAGRGLLGFDRSGTEVYRLRATASISAEASATIEALVRFSGDHDRPYDIIAWTERFPLPKGECGELRLIPGSSANEVPLIR